MASVAEDLRQLTDQASTQGPDNNPFFKTPAANTNQPPSVAVQQQDRASIICFPSDAKITSADAAKAIVDYMKSYQVLNLEMGGGSGAAKINHDQMVGLTQCSSLSMHLVRSTHVDINKATLTDAQFDLELEMIALIKNEVDRMEDILRQMILKADLMSAEQKESVLKLLMNTLTLEKIHAGELAMSTEEIEAMAKETLELLEELLDAELIPFDLQLMSLKAVQQIAKLFPDMDLQAKIDELAQKIIEPYVAKLNELLLLIGDSDPELKQIVEDLLEALEEDPLSIEAQAKIEALNEALQGKDFDGLAQDLMTYGQSIVHLQAEAVQAKHGISADYAMESAALYRALYIVRNAALGMSAAVIDTPRIFAKQPQAKAVVVELKSAGQTEPSSTNTHTNSQAQKAQQPDQNDMTANGNVVPLMPSVADTVSPQGGPTATLSLMHGGGAFSVAQSTTTVANTNSEPSSPSVEPSGDQPAHPIVEIIDRVLEAIAKDPAEIETAVKLGVLTKRDEFKTVIDKLSQPVRDKLSDGYKSVQDFLKITTQYVNETAKQVARKSTQSVQFVQKQIERAIKNGGKVVAIARDSFNVASQAAQDTWDEVNNYGRAGVAFAAEFLQDVAKKMGCAGCFTKACELCGIGKSKKTDAEAKADGQNMAQNIKFDELKM